MAAVLAPQVLATFRALFKGKQRATVFGVYGAVAGLAAAVGVTLGGVLTQANVLGLGWRAVFLVNVPVCVVILVVAGFVPETRAAGTQHMDVVGSIVLAAGIVAVYPLLEGKRLGWPLWGYVLLAAGLVALVALGVVEGHRSRQGPPHCCKLRTSGCPPLAAACSCS